MFSMWRRYAAVGTVAIAMLALGCESATEPVIAPEANAPTVEAPNNLLGGLLGGLVDGDDGLLGTVGDLLETSVELVRAVVYVVGELGEALIGPIGGILSVDDHDLTVPPGAVAHPTVFSMTVLDGRQIGVDLLATDPKTGEDVGEKGFLRPVQLALSYEDARVKRRDIDDLVIVRVHEDGTLEPLPSTVDKKTKQVRANLDHFSRYMLCSN